jgi:uncharacterized protein YchJ
MKTLAAFMSFAEAIDTTYDKGFDSSLRPKSKVKPIGSKIKVLHGDKSPKRNSLCACSSGKKYKKCCAILTGG